MANRSSFPALTTAITSRRLLPRPFISSMSQSSSQMGSSNDRLKRPEGSRNISITPQRKHRKLLKDGSGSEVWPECVEEIFVNGRPCYTSKPLAIPLDNLVYIGLRRYWESPWATYSRGRSRWRNQFLVDYLHKAGIDRSKKQVASHMQVLRNMWKGEPGECTFRPSICLTKNLPPEFHLVAGGEELFQESGLLATVKTEESCDSSPLTLNSDESDSVPRLSPSPPTPGFSPGEFKFESPSHSPSQTCSSIFDTYPASPFPIDSPHDHSSPSSKHEVGNVVLSSSPVTRGSPPSTFTFERQDVKQTASKDPSPLFTVDYQVDSYTPLAIVTSSTPIDSLPQIAKLDSPVDRTRFFDQVSSGTRRSTLPSPSSSANKLTSLCLWAEGMSPYNLSIDSLRASSLRPLSPIALQMKLSLPSIDDIHSLPTLHGFHGTVTFNAPWSSSAKCVTKVYTGRAFISEEAETLQLVASSASARDNCQLTGFLPSESSLSRSRWLDACKHAVHVSPFAFRVLIHVPTSFTDQDNAGIHRQRRAAGPHHLRLGAES